MRSFTPFRLFSSSTVMSILVLPFLVLPSELNLLAATQIKWLSTFYLLKCPKGVIRFRAGNTHGMWHIMHVSRHTFTVNCALSAERTRNKISFPCFVIKTFCASSSESLLGWSASTRYHSVFLASSPNDKT